MGKFTDTNASRKPVNDSILEEALLHQNELESNHFVTIILRLFSAVMVLLLIAWYAKPSQPTSTSVMYMIFPLMIILPLIPTILEFTSFKNKTQYKYMLLLVMIGVVSLLNIAFPRNAVLAWSVCVIIACHFYSTRLANTVYIVCSLMMLVCIYGGMLLGEWDSNLMYYSPFEVSLYSDTALHTVKWRIYYLDYLRDIYGEDRLVSVISQIYFPRLTIITLVHLAAALLNYRSRELMRRHTRMSNDKKRLTSELDVARQIQINMLPHHFPAFPDRSDFHIYATMSPARQVGGDFYDFFLLGDNKIGIVIADVSNKGIPAALFMAVSRTLLRSAAISGMDCAESFKHVNQLLCIGNDADFFVTAWFAIIDLKNGELNYVDAGHNWPALSSLGSSFEFVACHPDPVLGALDGVSYHQHTLRLNPGDILFLYTDGVTEATNNINQLYGTERMLDYLNRHRSDRPTSVLHGLRGDIDQFVNGAMQFDDITMLYFRFDGQDDVSRYMHDSDPDTAESLLSAAQENEPADNLGGRKLV